MTSTSELALSRARITRARDNINEFAEVLGGYLDRRPGELIVEINQRGQGTIRVNRLEPIPIQLPILLGEALHNLRAGLDNCLYAVAIIDSGMNPPPAAGALQWPIALTPKEWTENKKRLQHLSPHLLTALHRIQPFNAEIPGWNCLRILHDLARMDRHRVPRELAMWPRAIKGTYSKKKIHDLKVIEGPVSEAGVVVTFRKISPGALSPATLDLDFEFDIDVRDVELVPHPTTGVPARPWGSLDNRLKGMCKAVEEYAEGLIAIAQNPNVLLNDDEYQRQREERDAS